MAQQLTLDELSEEQEFIFNVYHDESGNYVPNSGDRWLLHGVLFLPDERQSQMYAALQRCRQNVGYYGEMHFSKLRGPGLKASCAKSWLSLYAIQFSEFCFYHCLAIDTRSPGFDHNRFSKPHHAYNRFARMAIEGAIAWSLTTYRRVALRFYSDAKFRQEGDNFAAYIPEQTCKSIAEKRNRRPDHYPEIRLLHPEVISVDSNPARVETDLKEASELIQLVDLMTSDIAQALTGRSGQRAKVELAEMVARWIEDTRKPPWLQTKELHRRFSVSCFPNHRGQFYNPSLAVMNRNQPPLFDLEEE